MKKVVASVPCETLGVRFAKKIPRGAQANFFFFADSCGVAPFTSQKGGTSRSLIHVYPHRQTNHK